MVSAVAAAIFWYERCLAADWKSGSTIEMINRFLIEVTIVQLKLSLHNNLVEGVWLSFI